MAFSVAILVFPAAIFFNLGSTVAIKSILAKIDYKGRQKLQNHHRSSKTPLFILKQLEHYAKQLKDSIKTIKLTVLLTISSFANV